MAAKGECKEILLNVPFYIDMAHGSAKAVFLLEPIMFASATNVCTHIRHAESNEPDTV